MLPPRFVKNFTMIAMCCAVFSSMAQQLENELETVFNDFELMGMAVNISVENTANTYNFGLRDFDRNLPVTNETLFRIASISKAVTALGVMKLVDNGSLNIDEDISTYLGYLVRNPNFPNTPITARMLLSHQSSLQDGTGYNNFLNATFSQVPIPNISELIVPNGNFYTSNMWRLESPGAYFSYSNVNFGLLGTLVEAVSNQRFDIFMKAEILDPLGSNGSFNLQDLDNINNLATLYRYQAGNWQPQLDNYEGIMPLPPDLSGYVPGTNGLFFSPQGGLRCTAQELSLFLDFLATNGSNSTFTITEETLTAMKAIAWDYNGNNGDTYGGLFNRWGLGLHHANVNLGDAICQDLALGTFLGHPGEAYGLISDAFFLKDTPVQIIILINGSGQGYQVGNETSFYTVEEAIFNVVCTYLDEVLEVDKNTAIQVEVFPNPAQHSVTIQHVERQPFQYTMLSIGGSVISNSDSNTNSVTLSLSHLKAGVYFLKISTPTKTVTKKIIIE